jgi:hypothetical protein
MFGLSGLLKYHLILYFIQQLTILSITGVDAFLDFETKEFLNGKTLRAAVLHVFNIIKLFLHSLTKNILRKTQ